MSMFLEFSPDISITVLQAVVLFCNTVLFEQQQVLLRNYNLLNCFILTSKGFCLICYEKRKYVDYILILIYNKLSYSILALCV